MAIIKSIKHYASTLLMLLIVFSSNAQQENISPYEWDWRKDGVWTGVALGGTVGGFLIIQGKDSFTEAEIAAFPTKINEINKLDRWVAGNYSTNASKISDIPFAISFAAPFALLLDGKINKHTGQLFGIYMESLMTTSALFTISAGLSNRARPYMYSSGAPLSKKTSTTATRSFYSGHVAATSTATFFAAKVFQDFNPDSKAIPYVWAGAITLPAVVGYYRMKAGQHFLTDVLLGYTLGALAGYYIPELHKTKNTESKIKFSTVSDFTPDGSRIDAFALKYTF